MASSPGEMTATGSVSAALPVLEIVAGKHWVPLNLRELWEYRELLFFLAQRDIKVRYKQTVLGAAWALIQPFFTMVVFSVFFGHLGGIAGKLKGLPPEAYPVFLACGLVPWQLFSYALMQASTSIVSEQRLITKVYFPRVVVPLAAVLSGLVDFSVAFVLVLGMMVYYGITPTWGLLALPALVVFAVVSALAVGLWLSALNVQYRDFRYTIPFLTQIWMFVTPVAYPSELVPQAWRGLYGLNPMAGVVEGFRWALLGQEPPAGGLLWVSVASVLLLLVGGLYYFRRTEDTFADIV